MIFFHSGLNTNKTTVHFNSQYKYLICAFQAFLEHRSQKQRMSPKAQKWLLFAILWNWSTAFNIYQSRRPDFFTLTWLNFINVSEIPTKKGEFSPCKLQVLCGEVFWDYVNILSVKFLFDYFALFSDVTSRFISCRFAKRKSFPSSHLLFFLI